MWQGILFQSHNGGGELANRAFRVRYGGMARLRAGRHLDVHAAFLSHLKAVKGSAADDEGLSATFVEGVFGSHPLWMLGGQELGPTSGDFLVCHCGQQQVAFQPDTRPRKDLHGGHLDCGGVLRVYSAPSPEIPA